MRNDDVLADVRELAQGVHETGDVLLVEGRVDLVEEAERRGLDHVGGEEEGHRRHRLLAARKEADVLELLPRGLREDVDTGLEDVLRVNEPDLASAAAEESAEHVMEVLLDFVVGREEELGRLGPDLLRDALQVVARLLEVGELRVEEVVAFLRLGEFLDGHQVDATKVAELLPRRREALAKLARGLSDREHALLEFHQIARVRLAEIVLYVADLGLGRGVLHEELLDLALHLPHLGGSAL